MDARNDGRWRTREPHGSHLKNTSMLWTNSQCATPDMFRRRGDLLMVKGIRVGKVRVPTGEQYVHEWVGYVVLVTVSQFRAAS